MKPRLSNYREAIARERAVREVAVKYVWKELSEDGLLRTPKDTGPYYERHSVNSYGGYDTKAEAIDAYEKFVRDHDFPITGLVLVEVFSYTTPETP